MSLLEKTLNVLLKHKVIVNCDGDPYLYRWYVFRTKRIALFLHKFVRSDEDRALHCHPWNFIVIPIWRGYVEHSDRECEPEVDPGAWMRGEAPRVPVVHRVYPIISTRFRRGTYRHRVELFKDPHNFDVQVDAGGKVHQDKGLPSWSLFFRFSEFRTWGFWPKTGFIAWNQWWKDHKCE